MQPHFGGLHVIKSLDQQVTTWLC